METKDWFFAIGVVLTFLVGVTNLFTTFKSTRRTAFVNTVTSERIKWIGILRSRISKLFAAVDQFVWRYYIVHPAYHTGGIGGPGEYRPAVESPSKGQLQREIEELRSEITLLLNPNEETDRAIIELLNDVPLGGTTMEEPAYRVLINKIVAATQVVLKREWEKVKLEAVCGWSKDPGMLHQAWAWTGRGLLPQW